MVACDPNDQNTLNSIFPNVIALNGGIATVCESSNGYVTLDASTQRIKQIDFSWLNLRLDNNGAISSQISNLAQLTYLELTNSGITSLPASICSLSNIEVLNLGSTDTGNDNEPVNRFSNNGIPTCIGTLPYLRHLNLTNTQLTSLPQNFFQGLTRMKKLYLNLNPGLSGSIPSSLTNCADITDLNLRGCQFSGRFDSFPWSTLSKLTFLDVGANRLSGTFPTSILSLTKLVHLGIDFQTTDGLKEDGILNGELPDLSGLVHLKYLDAHGNRFTGSIQWLQNMMANLTFVDLSQNHVTGTIPVGLHSNYLETLALNNCNLTGSIPMELGQSVNMTSLNLGNNFLTGTIPDLSPMTRLENLNLNQNYLNGTIPTYWANFPSLVAVDLSNNRFTGEVPASVFGNHTKLQLVDLSKNLLVGTLPELNYTAMQMLKRVNFEFNRLTGAIPQSFGRLTVLESLKLGYNDLEGAIPTTFEARTTLTDVSLDYNRLNGSLPNIPITVYFRSLTASSNQLSGSIPSWLFSQNGIQKLDLANNLFSGMIPPQIGSAVQLKYLDLSNNSLIGEIPSSFRTISNQGINPMKLTANFLNGTVDAAYLTTFGSIAFAENCFINNGLIVRSNCNGPSRHCGLLQEKFPTVTFGRDCINYDYVKFNLGGNVTELKMGSLGLGGSIPEEIGTFLNLTVLDFSNNTFNGTIPSSLGSLTRLTSLNLQNNFLSGLIPSSVQALLKALGSTFSSAFFDNCLSTPNTNQKTNYQCNRPNATTTTRASPSPAVPCNNVYDSQFEAIYQQQNGGDYKPENKVPGDAFAQEWVAVKYRKYKGMRQNCGNGAGSVGGIVIPQLGRRAGVR
ncbi:hypothetical protein BDR26DRAFT_869189 [Obelidium mucronatum]|nr:hypothetical protein BDR26DRAFT_869189 [Obelidium mucronatum]